MAYQDDLIAARANIAKNIKDMTANPKPSYSIDGKSVSWSEMLSNYLTGMEALDETIQRAGGPFAVSSQGLT